MKDTFEKFTLTTVAFHWIIAIAIIGMLAFGLYIEDMPKDAEKGELMDIHKSIGILILVFASFRILWRIKKKFPTPLSVMPKWQAFMAKLAHWVLILRTVMMPISGIIMTIGGGRSLSVFGYEGLASGEKRELLSEIGHTVNGLGSKLFIAFVVLHYKGCD